MTCESATETEHVIFRAYDDKKKKKKRKLDVDDSDGEPGHTLISTNHITELI